MNIHGCTNISGNDMEVCFIPKSEIFADLQKNPKFSFEVLKDMAHDLRDSDDVIVNMAQKSVRQRLAETLVYIHDTFGTNPDGTLSVLLSREDYANIVGTATESAIRVLSQFKKEGLNIAHYDLRFAKPLDEKIFLFEIFYCHKVYL